jgi:DNA-binding response OmpR family regulator
VIRQPRILVVEDNPADWFFAATALLQAGYKVDRASSGEHALARITALRPQCLLLNVFLPDTSGYAVCRQIRQKISESKVPIILTSTKTASLDKNYGLHQGAQRFLHKPFTAELLVQTVREVIRTPSMQTPTTAPQDVAPPSMMKCIPRHTHNEDELRTSNPFTYFALKDVQARQLYSAINGKLAVYELAATTGLNRKEISNTLQVLIKENYVQLYDSTGLPVNNTQAMSDTSSQL